MARYQADRRIGHTLQGRRYLTQGFKGSDRILLNNKTPIYRINFSEISGPPFQWANNGTGNDEYLYDFNGEKVYRVRADGYGIYSNTIPVDEARYRGKSLVYEQTVYINKDPQTALPGEAYRLSIGIDDNAVGYVIPSDYRKFVKCRWIIDRYAHELLRGRVYNFGPSYSGGKADVYFKDFTIYDVSFAEAAL